MTSQKHVKAGNVEFGNDLPLSIIAGPCQMESRDHAFSIAKSIKEICDRLNIGFVFKTSFDKANRTSIKGKRGIGLDKAIEVFKELKQELDIPIVTDIHEQDQCKKLVGAVDILQIPAFLCRQTDLLVAAAHTGLVINVKKGQFLAPWDMKNVAEKLAYTGNNNIMLTDRGTSFGYNTLISDMRGLAVMSDTGYPVIFDATHSIQQPGGLGGKSGGQREFIPVVSKAAVATRIAGVFIETHEDPDNAPSDGPCMLPLDELQDLLKRLIKIDKATKE